ncbi:FHA domain-containing protein [Bacteroides sp. UBA939]|uniref:FHA domain-containing protein n=1 Tax=Bacteroides sp. UBA939 TaxID=1946092 RepID=UPI0025C49B3E|nr:FHA domain-containing protein [Bacteroides sp. UBA939]
MEKNEILIGRQVDKGDFIVEEKYKSVGRLHAKITLKANGVYIEDLDSLHGTYINGSRVRSKKINRSDVVSLGGPDYYLLNINEVLRKLPLSDEEFSLKVSELKDIYNDYQSESNRLQSKMQEDMMTKRMLPTILLGAVTTLATIFVGHDSETKTIIAIGGAILSILMFVLATKWASKSSREMKEKLNRLNEKFELDYVCPACGAPYRGKSWEFVRRSGKCPACKREFHL